MEILVTLLISRFLHPFLTNGGESQDSQGFQNNLLEKKCELFYSLYGSTYFGRRYIEEQGSLTQHGLTLFFLCLVVVMLGPLIKISFILSSAKRISSFQQQCDHRPRGRDSHWRQKVFEWRSRIGMRDVGSSKRWTVTTTSQQMKVAFN